MVGGRPAAVRRIRRFCLRRSASSDMVSLIHHISGCDRAGIGVTREGKQRTPPAQARMKSETSESIETSTSALGCNRTSGTRFRKPIWLLFVTGKNAEKRLPGLGFGFLSFRVLPRCFSLSRAIDARWKRIHLRHRRPRSVFACERVERGRGVLFTKVSAHSRTVAGSAALRHK